MRYSRLYRRLRESAVAPSVSLSLYPRLLIRFAFPCFAFPCFARLQRLDVSAIRGYRLALPSVIASVKLRGAKGSYAMLSRATHEA